jgi:hypothetical protein
MRKHQQRQILELLQSMTEAQAAGLYAECQEGALEIGNAIESVEGDGTRTVALLVEYCELLFKANNGEVGEKALRKHMVRIVNSVKTELKPNRTEMAFLSYKASMSDSIKPIYLAAKADPDCDAYWIPIPYYDRNPDWTLGAMHCEGPEFYGEGIECTDWREYSIEERRPDAVFTFNPYDSFNIVTTVHPDYYCERLRDLTDLLVYVPYFVTASDDVGEHFSLTAGCIHAHRVVAQSERTRAAYIRAFKGKYGGTFGKPEKKFVALGSPKFDAVINAKREDYPLPNGWAKLVEGRKAVLYNTSIGTLLESNEDYLLKLRSVLECFRKRGDVALWWRPHPLNEATCAAMRPQLLREYGQIVAEYKSGGWGIYDDTPDLHRAVAWTDAYYGDVSSLVALYGVTGKPMMLQNASTPCNNADNRAIQYLCSYDDSEHIWFTPRDFNALFVMDKKTWKPKLMGRFTGEMRETSLFSTVAQCGGKLYFAPDSADAIAVYDKETGVFSSIGIKDLGNKHYYRYGFSTAYANGSDVFFFGRVYPAIIKLDTVTGICEYYSDYITRLNRMKIDSRIGYLGHGFANGSDMVLPVIDANAIVVFDMANCSAKVIEVPSKHKGYLDICYDGEGYWLAPNHSGGTVVRWNPTDGCSEMPVPDGWADGDYWWTCFAAGHVWYFSLITATAYKVNTASNEIEVAEPFVTGLCQSDKSKKAKVATFYKPYAYGSKIRVCRGKSNTLISYDADTGERREERILLTDENRNRLIALCIQDRLKSKSIDSIADCVFHDTTVFTLADYIEMLLNAPAETLDGIKETQLGVCRNTISNQNGTAGIEIYSEMKRQALK